MRAAGLFLGAATGFILGSALVTLAGRWFH